MMDLSESLSGHSTADALRILHDELQATLREHEIKQRYLSWGRWFRTSFLHHSNVSSVLQWTSILAVVLAAVLLIISFGLQDASESWLAVEALILLSIVVLNVYFVAWDDKLRQTEHIQKSQSIFRLLQKCIEDEIWDHNDYVSPHSPLSPCVTVQWTLRDCEILNIPCAFLVEGDVILLRPGQVVPAKCKYIGKGDPEKEALHEFNSGDLYNPWGHEEDGAESIREEPFGRPPLRPQPFLVLETPFVRNFKSILEKSLLRPASLLNNERFCVYTTWIERRIVPVVLIVMLFTNLLRYFWMKEDVGHWTDMAFVLPVQAVVPLLSLAFPIIWKLLDYLGAAKIVTAFDLMKRQAGIFFDDSDDSFQSEGSLNEDIDLSLKWIDVKSHFFDILTGKSDSLPRSSNILHAFGNTTSFTCVDKKGVLSWPNPTAEKVFFLTTKESTPAHHTSTDSKLSDSTDSGTTAGDTERDTTDSQPPGGGTTALKKDIDYHPDTAVQVLDITQDSRTPYDLHFDDPLWKSYINSLKPLGLDILLNTCNMLTADRYTEFADHVTCASLKREGAVPNMNRRCFCELARQIGFNDKAVKIFNTEHVLGMYRHVPQQTNKDKLKNSRSFIKYKMPMPNMFSVVTRDKNSGMSQLFSHGTADLLLDACSDFWDGQDLTSLSQADRKKIYDFYHRTSMSSYCTAFSYRPLSQNISDELNDVYIEVPETNHELFPLLRSPTPLRSWDAQSLDSRLHNNPHLNCSLDSLIMDNNAPSIHDIPGCFKSQCNQIFIGMITMQYQAKQDIVELIEDLDSACIRFVHFSKENELRSRVFSEKMGLEAGWNCHISLLSAERDVKKESANQSQRDLSQTSNSNRASRHSNRHSTESVHAKASNAQLRPLTTNPDGKSRSRRYSAPGAISTEAPHVTFEPKDVEFLIDGENTSCEANTLPEDESSAVDSPRFNSKESAKDDTREPLLPGADAVCKLKSRKSGEGTQSVSSKSSSPQKLLYCTAKSTSTTDASEPLLSKTDDEISTDQPRSDASALRSDVTDAEEMSQALELSDMGREGDDVDDDEGENQNRFNSTESFPASSYVTENTDSMTGVLGLSNRTLNSQYENEAKLPKGIENIRPHIENVDNVPLLVSLFTDCSSKTTQEMLKILQEHGEVVCCLGSSANIYNTDIFLQADCSISTEPLYPQICMREKAPTKGKKSVDYPMPMSLSSLLHSIPCSLSFHREESLSIIRLVALGRHHCQRMRNTFLMLLMCQLTLTMLLMFNSFLLLPPCLSPHLLLWLVGFCVPVLSLTMMGNPLDLQIVKMAQGKNKNHLPKHNMIEFICHFIACHLPCVLICLLCHSFTLTAVCTKVTISSQNLPDNITLDSNLTENCHVLLGKRDADDNFYWNGLYDEYRSGLTISQNLVAFQLVIYFICESLSFVHRLKHLWQKSPFRNKLWCIASPVILVAQVFYTVIDLSVTNAISSTAFTLADVPITTWLVMFLWPLVFIPILELLKHLEIKSWVRYQKRARLDFGTKLGMNSPF